MRHMMLVSMMLVAIVLAIGAGAHSEELEERTIELSEDILLIHALAYAPDGKTLLCGGSTMAHSVIQFWNAKTLRKIGQINGEQVGRHVECVAFSPKGEFFASGSGGGFRRRQSGRIALWDAQSRSKTASMDAHRSTVWSLAFAADGETLASAGDEEVIKLWEPGTGRQIGSLSGHESWVQAVAFAPKGDRLASVSFDASVRLWDAERGTLLKKLAGLGSYSVAWSSDGQLLAEGGAKGKVRIHDVRASAVKCDFQTGLGTAWEVSKDVPKRNNDSNLGHERDASPVSAPRGGRQRDLDMEGRGEFGTGVFSGREVSGCSARQKHQDPKRRTPAVRL